MGNEHFIERLLARGDVREHVRETLSGHVDGRVDEDVAWKYKKD